MHQGYRVVLIAIPNLSSPPKPFTVMKTRFLLSLALAAAACTHALAAQFLVVIPVPGQASSKPPIQLVLHPAALPDAIAGKPYSHDFTNYLQITGDEAAQPTMAAWSADSVPSGLALNAAGLLSGSPLELSPAGKSFTVTARYKGQSGQQVYTLRVGYETLDVVKVSAGYEHACAITVAGELKCWGGNAQGQLGNGSSTGSNVPIQVPGLTNSVTEVAAGGAHTCAIRNSTVYCWGLNSSGQLGNGNTNNSAVPVVASAAGSATALTVGGYHTCAVTTAGGIQCFGYGAGTFGFTSGVTAVASTSYHTCVIHNGAAKCWGPNDQGQLGGGHNEGTWDVLQVQGLTSGVTSIASGYSHSCATKSDGTVWCWGWNEFGQIGAAGGSSAFAPVQVPGVVGASKVVANSSYSCASTASAVYCWGGAPGLAQSPVATTVTGFDGGSQITAGGTFMCAVGGNTAKCMGGNGSGQLGNGGGDVAAGSVPVRK